jgi:hypothetical protein
MMPRTSQLLVNLDRPQLLLQLIIDGQPAQQAETLPLPLGDAALAVSAPWSVAAAALETAVGPAWRSLPPVRTLVDDDALWRLLRRRVVGGCAVSQRLTDLLTAAAVIGGLPLPAAEFPPPSFTAQPYHCHLRGTTLLQLDWRDALTQLLVDLTVGTAAETAVARLSAALFAGLISACQRLAASCPPQSVIITAAPPLAGWARALCAALQRDGFSVLLPAADRG